MGKESTYESAKIDELIFWIKFSVWTTFVKTLKATLTNDLDMLVYELSEDRSTREIANLVSKTGRKITHVTVKNMWQRWSEVPIVIPSDKKGRFKRVLSLKTVGITVPDMDRFTKEGETTDEQETR